MKDNKGKFLKSSKRDFCLFCKNCKGKFLSFTGNQKRCLKCTTQKSICLGCSKEFSFYYAKPKIFCSHFCFLKRKISKETKIKMSEVRKGKTPKNFKIFIEKGRLFNLGSKHSEEHKRKIGLAGKGRKMSDLTKNKIGSANSGINNGMYGKGNRQLGSNNPSWKGGLSSNAEHQRKRSSFWKKNNREKVNFSNKQYEYRLRNALGKHSLKEWNDLKQKYNYMCLCCKRSEPEIILSEDHILPISKGGDNWIKNIQPLCISCNARKRDKEIDFISQYYKIKQNEF